VELFLFVPRPVISGENGTRPGSGAIAGQNKMNFPKELYLRVKRTLKGRWRRFLRLRSWEWWFEKVTFTLDRRLLIVMLAVATVGAVQIFRGFGGVQAIPVADTAESSDRWPEAGGRLFIKSWEWWGLKRAEFLAEPRWIDSDDGREKRWMIIESTGSQIDGWAEVPRPLFFDDHDPNNSGTGYNIWSKDRTWFNYRRIEAAESELK
jgi:hypothetical protein